jgi:hypothetical protein
MSTRHRPAEHVRQRERVIRSLDGAARTYFALTGLARAAGASKAAGSLLDSAVRLIVCLHQVIKGDAQLTTALAAAIESLPAEPAGQGSWYGGVKGPPC